MPRLSHTQPHKEIEFDIFTSIMSDPVSAPNLVEIAQALGVARETLTDWSKRPEVIAAKTAGIRRYTNQMEKTGRKDWKMWEKRLALAGINPPQNLDIKSGGEPLKGLIVVKDSHDSPE